MNVLCHIFDQQKALCQLVVSCAFVFSLQSCGIPVGGCDGDSICVDPAGAEIVPATSDDIRVGTTAISVEGEYIEGSLKISTLIPTRALRSSDAETPINTSQADAEASLNEGYDIIPVLGTSTEAHGDSLNVEFVDRSALDVIGTCGTTQATVEERIIDCKNVMTNDRAVWNGNLKANSGEGVWSLVSFTENSTMVWRDETTGLLWSDDLNVSTNWCRASGNRTPLSRCTLGGVQTTPPTSYCAEVDNDGNVLTVPTDSANAKAGLNRDTHGVHWRLPTKNDFLQAELNGLRWIYRDLGPTREGGGLTSVVAKDFWTSTPLGTNATKAWFFTGNGSINPLSSGNIDDTVKSVICVAGFTPANTDEGGEEE